MTMEEDFTVLFLTECVLRHFVSSIRETRGYGALHTRIGLIGNVLPIIAHCHLPVVGSRNDPAQNKSLIKTYLDSLGLFLISFSLFCVT